LFQLQHSARALWLLQLQRLVAFAPDCVQRQLQRHEDHAFLWPQRQHYRRSRNQSSAFSLSSSVRHAPLQQ
jgi:hypothetical protein